VTDASRRGALMVCGTASDVGKSLVVAGLCRLLHRRGVSVAPFKGQNMALNSAVTVDGAEIGRAQAAQASAAGVVAEAAMNPVLLKPTSERTSQVVVLGRPWRTLDAAAFQQAKAELADVVLEALTSLRRRFDVVLLEGAGSPAEINLYGHDLVNLGLAHRAGVPAIVVGDIDRGGVFAHLYGTVALLPPAWRDSVRGFVINRFRGDPALLAEGPAELEQRCGVPTLGVLPWLDGVDLDAEDSLALRRPRPRPYGPGTDDRSARLDVAVVALPHLSNFTDLDALAVEPDATVRFVSSAGDLGRPDLLVLPGTKATVADLEWLRAQRLDRALEELAHDRPVVLAICGGYQMLGATIVDEQGVESARPRVAGLGWLDVVTRFSPDKCTRVRQGHDRAGHPVAGYEIHHGRPEPGRGGRPWLALDAPAGPEDEGVVDEAAGVYATSLHGLLEGDEFRRAFLTTVAEWRGRRFVPSARSFAAARQEQFDRVADACEAHLDVTRLLDIVAEGAPAGADA